MYGFDESFSSNALMGERPNARPNVLYRERTRDCFPAIVLTFSASRLSFSSKRMCERKLVIWTTCPQSGFQTHKIANRETSVPAFTVPIRSMMVVGRRHREPCVRIKTISGHRGGVHHEGDRVFRMSPLK